MIGVIGLSCCFHQPPPSEVSRRVLSSWPVRKAARWLPGGIR